MSQMLPSTWTNVAWEAVLDHRFEEAIAIYQRELRGCPSIGEWNNAGIAYLMNGERDQALLHFQYAQTLPAGDVIMSLLPGVALAYMEKYEQACQSWKEQNELRKRGQLTHFKGSGSHPLCLMWAISNSYGLPEFHEYVKGELEQLTEAITSDKSEITDRIAKRISLSYRNPTQFSKKMVELGTTLSLVPYRPPSLVRKIIQARFYAAVLLGIMGRYHESLAELDQAGHWYHRSQILVPEHHLAHHLQKSRMAG